MAVPGSGCLWKLWPFGRDRGSSAQNCADNRGAANRPIRGACEQEPPPCRKPLPGIPPARPPCHSLEHHAELLQGLLGDSSRVSGRKAAQLVNSPCTAELCWSPKPVSTAGGEDNGATIRHITTAQRKSTPLRPRSLLTADRNHFQTCSLHPSEKGQEEGGISTLLTPVSWGTRVNMGWARAVFRHRQPRLLSVSPQVRHTVPQGTTGSTELESAAPGCAASSCPVGQAGPTAAPAPRCCVPCTCCPR